MKQIQFGTKEFYELLEYFEKINNKTPEAREKPMLPNVGAYYENAEFNKEFNSFWNGVNYGIRVTT